MTNEELQVLVRFIQKQLNQSGPHVAFLNQSAILGYYIEHQQDIDVAQLVKDAAQEKVAILEQQISDKQAELATVQSSIASQIIP